MTELNSEGLEKAYKAAEQIDGEWVTLRPNMVEAVVSAYLAALLPVDGLEVVAWRVKDYADGWVLCSSEQQAASQSENGNLAQPLVTLSQASSVIAGLKDEIADLRDEWQAEYDTRLAANTARRAAEARISSLEEENKRLQRKIDLLETTVSFTRRWATEKEGNGTSAEERLSAIANHPGVKGFQTEDHNG